MQQLLLYSPISRGTFAPERTKTLLLENLFVVESQSKCVGANVLDGSFAHTAFEWQMMIF